MTTERARPRQGEDGRLPTRSISELQRDAPGIVREASERGEVEIRRYGEAVAYLVSPEERERLRRFRRAWERLDVALQYKRALDDWEAGNVVPWEEVEAELRAIVDRK